ncbi:MAG: Fur family transcriptional regulator [Vulcanimicrobiota bacterium]
MIIIMRKELEIFRNFIKTRGLKYSNQRKVILETFLSTEGHITAEELYKITSRENKNIGFSTIYRTLKLLEEAGLARKIQAPNGTMIFEHKYNHHHHDHLICNQCGKFIEFYNENIEQLQKKVAQKFDFAMSGHRLIIYGLCRDCQNSC